MDPAAGESLSRLGRLARAVLARPRTVWTGTALLAILAGGVALPPRVDADLSQLMPRDEPHAIALREVAERGGVNGLHLTFAPTDPEALDLLAAELDALPEVAWARHRLPPGLTTHLAAMRLEPGELEDLADRTQMALSLGGAANPVVLEAVFGDAMPLLEPVSDGIFVMPATATLDPAASEATVAAVHTVITRHPEMTLEREGGPIAVVADGARAIRSDLARTSVGSAVLVWVLLALGLRAPTWRARALAPLALLLPCAVAAVLDLAVARLLFGALNAYTAIGTALLLGLGVDIGIHLARRFADERPTSSSKAEALERAWSGTGPACVTATLTSAAAFAALALADFRGLSQLGWLLAIGMLLSLGTMLVLLPLLLPDAPDTANAAPPKARTRRTWVRPLAGVALVATLAMAATRSVPSFDADFSRLGRDPERARSSYPPIALDHADPAAAADSSRALQEALAAGRLPNVVAVVSADTLLPPDQPARVAALIELKAALDHPSFRHLPGPVRQGLGQLVPWESGPRTFADLPPLLRSLLDDGCRVLLRVDGPLHDMRVSGELMDAVDAVAGPAASEQMVQGALYRMIRADAPRIVGATALLVLALIAVDLRHPMWVGVAVGALGVGCGWAAFALHHLQVPITLANVAGLPMLLGLGVDAVLHLVHRIRESGSVVHALNTAGRAALLSTATTLASFGALGLASSGGVRSLGLLVGVGLPTVTVTATIAVVLVVAATRR